MPLRAHNLVAIVPDRVLHLSANDGAAEGNGLIPIVKMGVGNFHDADFAVRNIAESVDARRSLACGDEQSASDSIELGYLARSKQVFGLIRDRKSNCKWFIKSLQKIGS